MLASSNCSKEIVLNPEHPFQYIVGESPPHTERELGGGEGEAQEEVAGGPQVDGHVCQVLGQQAQP